MLSSGSTAAAPGPSRRERESLPLGEFVSFAAPTAAPAIHRSNTGGGVDAGAGRPEGDLVYREWDPLPWTAVPQKDGTMSYASLPQSSPLLRLHQEIMQFTQFITPTPAEERWGC